MSKKMPKKMRARHARTKLGGDRDLSLNGQAIKVQSKYGNENIENIDFALTPEGLAKWLARKNTK